jgi:hypothetical protein
MVGAVRATVTSIRMCIGFIGLSCNVIEAAVSLFSVEWIWFAVRLPYVGVGLCFALPPWRPSDLDQHLLPKALLVAASAARQRIGYRESGGIRNSVWSCLLNAGRKHSFQKWDQRLGQGPAPSLTRPLEEP